MKEANLQRMCCVWSLSCVWPFVMLWTIDCQAPLTMGVLQARTLEWVVMPSSGDLPNPGIEARSPSLQVDSLPLSHQGSPRMLEWVAYPWSPGGLPDPGHISINAIIWYFGKGETMKAIKVLVIVKGWGAWDEYVEHGIFRAAKLLCMTLQW